MRWDGQTVENDERARLPGHADTAVVRRFKAPEALDTRFYEVRAKSALNRVPAASRVPFPWTVNPYRGCSHACTYCVSGTTPVLMADGRTRPIEDLRRSATRSYGTERSGALSTVRAHRVSSTSGSTIKPACRVALEDGTELDHERRPSLPVGARLEARGRHVIAPASGRILTTSNSLLGTGRVRRPPAAVRRIQAWIPVRDDPRRRAPRLVRHIADAPHVPVPARARRLRGAPSRAAVPGRLRSASQRAAVRGCFGRISRGPRDPDRLLARRSRRSLELVRWPQLGRASSGARAFSRASSTQRDRAAARRCGSATRTREILHWTRESLDMLGFDTCSRTTARRTMCAPSGSAAASNEQPAVLPPHRPGDHAEADDRRHRA